MEKEKNGILFRLAMSAAFMIGAIAFVFALIYTSGILCRICFGFLALMSLLCAFGMTAVEAAAALFSRTSTRFLVFMFPFSVNGGILAAEILLLNDKDTAALAAAIAAAAVSVIVSSALVKRYLEDDF